MIAPAVETELREFGELPTVAAKWEAARRLMTNRQLQLVAQNPAFQKGFRELGAIALSAEGIDRLLAIALIVRISEFLKGSTKQESVHLLSSALETPLDSISQISEKKALPVEAKPAEIRENIALSLDNASGAWVLPYAFESLVREDRSQRCRLELVRQIAARDKNVAHWVEWLAAFSWRTHIKLTANESAARARDIADAMTSVIRMHRARYRVSPNVGVLFAQWIDKSVQVSNRALPNRIDTTASAILSFLDELIATEITLIEDSETYAVLGTIFRWWQPLPYPQELKLSLEGIVRKLTSAITLLARKGQRSEALASRLQQALGPNVSVRPVLIEIADSEKGLLDGIDDWLRGNERKATATSGAIDALLSGQDTADAVSAIAPLLLDLAGGRDDDAEISNHEDDIATLRRMRSRVGAIALTLGLEVVGREGELVEFNPNTHRTIDGTIPPEPVVQILRPMVVRNRKDGSHEIIERAIVATEK